MRKRLPIAPLLIGSAAWQGLWFLIVWGAGAGHTVWPSLVALPAIACAAWYARADWWRVLAVVAVAVACGLAVDGSLIKTGQINYGQSGLLPPLWILMLWALFGAAVSLPLRGILRHGVVAGVAGAISGPLAYWGGRQLDALVLGPHALLLVGIFYALATPVIVLTAKRLEET